MKTFNIAIIGSGPAGMFSAMALQQAENDAIKFNIDIFEVDKFFINEGLRVCREIIRL